MGKRIAGVCSFKVNGAAFSVSGSLDVQPMTTKNEKLVGMSGPAGHKETNIVPYIEGEIFLVPGLSLKDLAAFTDETVQADLANGRSYVLRNACWAGDVVAKAADGTAAIRFEGEDCEEL